MCPPDGYPFLWAAALPWYQGRSKKIGLLATFPLAQLVQALPWLDTRYCPSWRCWPDHGADLHHLLPLARGSPLVSVLPTPVTQALP